MNDVSMCSTQYVGKIKKGRLKGFNEMTRDRMPCCIAHTEKISDVVDHSGIQV